MLFSGRWAALALGVALVGCADRTGPDRRPLPRIALGGSLDRELRVAPDARPLESTRRDDAGCERFSVPGAGEEFGARLLERWQPRDAAWLFEGVAVQAEAHELILCADLPTRDLAERLTDVALWPATGIAAWRSVAVRGSERQALADGGIDLLLERGDPSAPSARRAAGWDELYLLAIEPERRWVNDPRLRRWLGRVVDRSALAALIEGGARPCADLRCLREEGEAPGRRPLAESSRPRLRIAFAADDRVATVIARRLKAELEGYGLKLELDADGIEAADLTVVVHRRRFDDALLSLEATLRALGPKIAGETQIDGRRLLSEAAREAALARWEQSLHERATLVPLLRREAWLVGDVEGWVAAPYGGLRAIE